MIELSSRCVHDEERAHTFLHELLHAAASAMGWNKFNNDETRIDAMAALLLQALTTGK